MATQTETVGDTRVQQLTRLVDLQKANAENLNGVALFLVVRCVYAFVLECHDEGVSQDRINHALHDERNLDAYKV